MKYLFRNSFFVKSFSLLVCGAYVVILFNMVRGYEGKYDNDVSSCSTYKCYDIFTIRFVSCY